MTREEILEAISKLNAKGTSEVSLRSNLRSISKTSLEETISRTSSIECSEVYSYENLIESISDRIDLSLQVRPEKSDLDVVNDNPFGPNHYKEDGSFKEGTTTTTVPESQVPESAKVPTTEEVKTSEGEKTNETYVQAKAAGITAGSSAAASAYSSSYAGRASQMPTKSVGAAPSLATTEFVPDTTGEETKTTETNPTDVPYDGEETFVPVSSNVSNIKSELMAMKDRIVSAYTYAYNDTLDENSKRM